MAPSGPAGVPRGAASAGGEALAQREARPHVHVQGERGEAKFWIEPEIALARNYGLSRASLRTAMWLNREHEDEISAAWKEHFRR